LDTGTPIGLLGDIGGEAVLIHVLGEEIPWIAAAVAIIPCRLSAQVPDGQLRQLTFHIDVRGISNSLGRFNVKRELQQRKHEERQEQHPTPRLGSAHLEVVNVPLQGILVYTFGAAAIVPSSEKQGLEIAWVWSCSQELTEARRRGYVAPACQSRVEQRVHSAQLTASCGVTVY
jgi:hypothetical protein